MVEPGGLEGNQVLMNGYSFQEGLEFNWRIDYRKTDVRPFGQL